MQGLDINTLMTLSPAVAVLLYIVYRQEKRIDAILEHLLRYCEEPEDDDVKPL